MAACPNGHQSTATDYCDVCGAALAAPTSAALAPTETGAGPPCPECGTPPSGRFCEVCGHDFLGAAMAPATLAPASPATSRPVAGATGAAPPDGPTARAATEPGPVAASTTGWVLVATADSGYHQRMRAAAGPDAEPVPFPAYCPPRRFPLTGQQLLIGRHSRSRGIEPDIDLTGPPEDAGVSHAHALVVAHEGGWAVVDLGSANGTYLGDGADPIAPHTPVPLAPGDGIHLGAWTTLTLQAV
jgi:hypothetical protein